MAEEFGDFEVVVETKPELGVVQGEIPPKLAEYLEKNYKEALDHDNKELLLKARDEKTAKRLALYARAWGARQEPKLRITKLPNRQGMADSVARLNVQLDAEVAPENKPGRRAATPPPSNSKDNAK